MAVASRGAFEPGSRVDNFEIIRKIATGGMAELYLARAVGIGGFEKLVAIKVMVGDDLEEVAHLFLDEARLVARLQHPNIVQVHGVGQDGDRLYQIMEYVDGIDARRLLRSSTESGQPLRLDIALAIVRAVANALHYSHTLEHDGAPLGIVHRDVSPSNILIGHDGWVKLADFGIATSANRRARTKVGSVRGKPGYMSPEQCQGLSVDRRTDVFNLGIVLFELTTGRKLYRGENDLALLHEIVYQDPQTPSQAMPGYPPDLERIVMRALARDQSKRYQSAAELADELDDFARARGLDILSIDPEDLAPLMPVRGTAPRKPLRPPTEATAIPARAAPPSVPSTSVPSTSVPSTSVPSTPRAESPAILRRPGLLLGFGVAILVGGALAWYLPSRASEPTSSAAANGSQDIADEEPTAEVTDGDGSSITTPPAVPTPALADTNTKPPVRKQRPRPPRATKARDTSPEPAALPTDLKSPFPPAP